MFDARQGNDGLRAYKMLFSKTFYPQKNITQENKKGMPLTCIKRLNR